MNYLSIGLRILLTLIFAAAGSAKLFGAEMMAETFATIGWGQWFRYVTAFVEIGCAALLWAPGFQVLGAGLLLITMICAALIHVLILGPSALPALILGFLYLALVYLYREQLSVLLSRNSFS